MKKRFPESFYNPITFAGAIIASTSFGLILFLSIIDATSAEQSPYLGIITFIIFPGILIFGLLLIAFGIFKAHKQKVHGTFHISKFPVLDLNNPKHRISFTVFSVGTILFLVFTAFGSFKAYEYTETVEFCGTVCHNVMNPSPRAFVPAVRRRDPGGDRGSDHVPRRPRAQGARDHQGSETPPGHLEERQELAGRFQAPSDNRCPKIRASKRLRKGGSASKSTIDPRDGSRYGSRDDRRF